MTNRIKYVGASEAAALFDCHPFMTRRELYHRKRSELSDVRESNVMRLGSYLEPFILEQTFPNAVRSEQKQVPHPEIHGLACTPDAFTEIGELIEIKSVSQSPDTAAVHHVIQCQVQMMVLNQPLVHLVYFNRSSAEHKIIPVYDNPELVDEIETRVNEFWSSVNLSLPPDAAARDFAPLKKIIAEQNPTQEITILNDNWLNNAIHNYLQATKDEKEMDARLDKAKAELMGFLQDNNLCKVTTNDAVIKISISEIAERTSTTKAHTRVSMTVKEK